MSPVSRLSAGQDRSVWPTCGQGLTGLQPGQGNVVACQGATSPEVPSPICWMQCKDCRYNILNIIFFK